MDNQTRNAFFKQVGKEPFAQKFGVKLLTIDDGYSKVQIKFTADMENFLGTAHGERSSP
jgi:acyl-coenzyme A thioesterase PaaI-like protein